MRKCWHPEKPCDRRKTEVSHGDNGTVEGMRSALKEAQNTAKLRKYAKGRME